MQIETKHNLQLKKVDSSYCKFLFDLANDVSVRSNAINPKPIYWNGHLAWFDQIMKSKKTTIFILEKDNSPVGQIRFDNIIADKWEIDYAILNEERGKGLGKWLLSKAISEMHQTNREFVAIVKSSNIPSKKVFESIGFVEFDSFRIEEEIFLKFKMKAH